MLLQEEHLKQVYRTQRDTVSSLALHDHNIRCVFLVAANISYCTNSNGYNKTVCRSSCLEVFCKKGVLKNFAKLTGKHLCQNHFFNKVAAPRPATLLEKRPWHRCFLVNLAKFLRTSFFIEYPWWLLLCMGLIFVLSFVYLFIYLTYS